MIDREERPSPAHTTDRYQGRLEDAQKVLGYEALSDEVKQYIALLAFDKDLTTDDFNYLLNVELGWMQPDAKGKKAMSQVALAELVAAPEVDGRQNLPNTFDEAHKMAGHSIDDILDEIENVNDLDSYVSSWQPKTDSDRVFFQKDNLMDHSQKVVDFTHKYSAGFPGRLKDESYSVQDAWIQHNSRAFVRSRHVDKSTDKPVSRIYLNPEYDNVLSIYKQVIAKAEKMNLRFKSKIFGFASRQEDYANYFSSQSNIKIDPVVIYGFIDSQDELLRIVEEVYAENEASFSGRTIGKIPMKIAPGFALGSEPTGLSGEESLTSHREYLLNSVLHSLQRSDTGWNDKTEEQKKRKFANSFRQLAMNSNVDPDNIAFDQW